MGNTKTILSKSSIFSILAILACQATTAQETKAKGAYADGVRLEHISEMFRLKGGEIHGDLRPRSTSRLAILPNTTHVTLMDRMREIVPMVNDFFDAESQKQ